MSGVWISCAKVRDGKSMKEAIQERAKQIEQRIHCYLPQEKDAGYEKTIVKAMHYSLMAGGKRLRPMLMQESFRMFGGEGACVEPFMAAMECIHTYSLVHDDLPAMDDDEYRRGKKTTHKVFGEAMGILAGDALLNYAYELMAGAMTEDMTDTVLLNRKAEAFKVIARAAGICGMVGGQVVDVESENLSKEQMTRDKIEYIYHNKTGALLEASLQAGAILAGADEMAVKQIGRAGQLLGYAFQIQDDILDLTSTVEELGKPIGSDEKNHKVTYVTLCGLEQARKDVENYSYKAISILEGCVQNQDKSEFLRNLFAYLIHRTY